MLGMAKSVMTKSNLPMSNSARASLPLLAVSTMCPSNASIILTASQTKGSSSTTKIRRCGEAAAVMRNKNGESLTGSGKIASLSSEKIVPTKNLDVTPRTELARRLVLVKALEA